MKYIGYWALGVVAIGGISCAGQGSTDGNTTTQTGAGTLLDAVKLDPGSLIEGEVKEVNIVTDDQAVNTAAVTDGHLLNPWGLAFFPDGPAWISLNGNNTLDVYDGAGDRLREVMIPATGDGGATPDGIVFNPDTRAFRGDTFIAVTEDGAVIGWKPSDDGTAKVRRDDAPAVYKGVTRGSVHGRPMLYAADFHGGAVVALDERYHTAHLPGDFTDPGLPAGYGPFNVMDVGPFLLVSYAKQDDPTDPHDDQKGPGNGLVDLFTTEGFFVQRLIDVGGALDSPWAMVFAPDRDRRSIDLLVGNFGDGRINVYDLGLRNGHLDATREGALGDSAGHPIVIDGLWALAFGSGGAGFDAGKLYFTAGSNGENDGLFGSLTFSGPRK